MFLVVLWYLFLFLNEDSVLVKSCVWLYKIMIFLGFDIRLGFIELNIFFKCFLNRVDLKFY